MANRYPRHLVDVTVGIPIKPFGAAKRRLAVVLDDARRRRLAMALAERTVSVVADAGASPLVLSADDEVTAWARRRGVPVLLDEGSSLDAAAADAVRHARATGSAWAILHADLPVLIADELAWATDHLRSGGAVLSPSSDGGTSLVGSSRDRFPFSYGPGSFHRHLATLAPDGPLVGARTGLLLDLDDPSDLAAASRAARGAWLRE